MCLFIVLTMRLSIKCDFSSRWYSYRPWLGVFERTVPGWNPRADSLARSIPLSHTKRLGYVLVRTAAWLAEGAQDSRVLMTFWLSSKPFLGGFVDWMEFLSPPPPTSFYQFQFGILSRTVAGNFLAVGEKITSQWNKFQGQWTKTCL